MNIKTNFDFALNFVLIYINNINHIPIEVKNIIQLYAVAKLNNSTIRDAVELWYKNDSECIIRFGHISF